MAAEAMHIAPTAAVMVMTLGGILYAQPPRGSVPRWAAWSVSTGLLCGLATQDATVWLIVTLTEMAGLLLVAAAEKGRKPPCGNLDAVVVGAIAVLRATAIAAAVEMLGHGGWIALVVMSYAVGPLVWWAGRQRSSVMTDCLIGLVFWWGILMSAGWLP